MASSASARLPKLPQTSRKQVSPLVGSALTVRERLAFEIPFSQHSLEIQGFATHLNDDAPVSRTHHSRLLAVVPTHEYKGDDDDHDQEGGGSCADHPSGDLAPRHLIVGQVGARPVEILSRHDRFVGLEHSGGDQSGDQANNLFGLMG